MPLCQGREKTPSRVERRCRSGREVKGPAGMAGEPLADLRMFIGDVIVDDRLDRFPRWSPLLDGVEEANELSMRWRCMLRPITVPSSTLSAANSVVVPCRL